MENKTPEEYQNEIDVLQTKLAEKEKDLGDALEINQNLSLEVERLSEYEPKETKTSTSFKTLTFEYEGKTFGFNFPSIILNRKQITAGEVAEDPALQKALIDNNSGMIFKK